ncbi:MAG: alanine racemase [Propionibacterium sp.]|nr:alanine racemase [Propionibacterium sp.]
MLKLSIDGDAWRAHLRGVAEAVPGLVPVAKGNGYGFGNARLAQEAAKLGSDTIAVGIPQEVNAVKVAGFEGDIVVLNPWRPHDDAATACLTDPQVISTVSRVEDVKAIARNAPGSAVLIEIATSMHRHGIAADSLQALDLDGLDVRGWTIHLPAAGSVDEARRLATAVAAHPKGSAGVWFSHLGFDDYRALAAELPMPTRMRVGTRLWLGAPETFRATGTVLDVHKVGKGTEVGYHGARTRADGYIVVVSGGTAHGVALAAPATAHSFRQRLIPLAEALEEVRGRVTSPFTLAGKKRPFAEPPHMHSSLVFVDGPGEPARVGDEVPVTVRMTTTTFDEVVFTVPRG